MPLPPASQPAPRQLSIGLMLLIGALYVPALGLAVSGNRVAAETGWSWVQDLAFWSAVKRSLVQSLWVASLAWLIGWPCGVWIGLYRFQGRTLALGALILPLMLPPFLWAIGWSFLRGQLPYRYQWLLDGLPGCVLTGLQLVIPLVALVAVLSTATISVSQRFAVEISGGPRALWWRALGRAAPVTLAAAGLGSIYTLADSGPAQIMGYHGVASEVLIAFASRFDTRQAAQQAVLWMLGVLPFLVPFILILSRGLLAAMDARENSLWAGPLAPTWRGKLAAMVGWTLALGLLLPGLVGLLRPLNAAGAMGAWSQALEILRHSGTTTVFYCAIAGLTAGSLGWLSAQLTKGRRRSQQVLLIASFLLLGLPPAVHALGVVGWASLAPPWLDPLARSGWRVGLTLGLTLCPLAILVNLWTHAAMPGSWEELRQVHGISRRCYATRVLIPQLFPVLLATGLVVAYLAGAEVSSTLLLQPPGSSTFPGRLFSMMDNASERLVAALAGVYLLCGVAILFLAVTLARWHRRLSGGGA